MKSELDSPKELVSYALGFLCVAGLCLLLAALHVAAIGPCADPLGTIITGLFFLSVPIGMTLLVGAGARWLWLRRAR